MPLLDVSIGDGVSKRLISASSLLERLSTDIEGARSDPHR